MAYWSSYQTQRFAAVEEILFRTRALITTALANGLSFGASQLVRLL